MINGPVNYGTPSQGFVNVAKGGRLSQSCNTKPPKACGQIVGGTMSTVKIAPGGKLIQDPESSLICGNYTIINLDKGCELSMRFQSNVRPNIDFGGGRIEVRKYFICQNIF